MSAAIAFDAVYFDGRTSARRPVRVQDEGARLHVLGDGVDVTVPLGDVRWEAPVAGKRHALHLPAGAQLQTEDAAALARLFPDARRGERWLEMAEARWKYALAAVAAIALITGAAIVFGVPVLAKHVAAVIPPALEQDVGTQTLRALDHFCSASALSPGRQQALRGQFAKLVAAEPEPQLFRLEFRSCGRIGANAFALPGGTIVLTDDLVTLATADEQLDAVLAHEVGHVRHRHALRLALQATGVAALVTALAGDAVSITGLAVALPTALLQTSYSREFEEEADEHAFRRLRELGISPRHFADIMGRLEQSHRPRGAAASGEEGPLDYLSTHPATARRIERARAAAER